LLTACVCRADAPTTAPATQPAADPMMDYLLESAQPATTQADHPNLPATGVATPLATGRALPGTRRATITLSDGRVLAGPVRTTADQPIRIFDTHRQEFIDVPFDRVASLRAEVVWERLEREWHFVESGSDIREYTGHTYPARLLEYTLNTASGKSYRGGVSAPLYLEESTGKSTLYILDKRQKSGDLDSTLEDLVYVKQVDFVVDEP